MANRLTWRAIPRPVRLALWSLAVVVVLLAAGTAALFASFDPDSLKPRIIAAVRQATGRDVMLQGRIGLALSLPPTLSAQDVSFANPPGFSRPQMVTLNRLDLQLAVLPLLSHRIEIDRLVLVKPNILLETDAEGRPNWQFTREAVASQSPAGDKPSTGMTAKTPTRISIAEVQIEDGALAWHDGVTGRTIALRLPQFQASAGSPEANTRLSAEASYDGTAISLNGEVGPLSRLEQPMANTPWPVHLTAGAVDATLSVDGTIAEPMEGRGYVLKLAANAPDLAALVAFLPQITLPDLHDVSVTAQLTGTNRPDVTNVSLHAGPSDLTQTVAGLKLDKLDIAAQGIDQPLELSAEGSFHQTPAKLTASLSAPIALLQATTAPRPLPFRVSVQAIGSALAANGVVTYSPIGRSSLQLDAKADKIDADALTAAFAGRANPPPNATSAPPEQPTKPAPASHPVSERPIPFDLLQRADADVTLSIAELQSRGTTYRAIAAHLDLKDGKLRLDPVSANLPEGHLDAALTADATLARPAVTLRLKAPALALQPLLAALHQPPYGTGNLEVNADLHSAGATPHALLADLSGSLGVGMANGTVDNRLLGSALGAILREASLLDLVGRGGTSEVQCFAARFDATHGVATVRPLVLSSSLLTMDGYGTVNLPAETLDLHVQPQGRVGGTALVVPLHVAGTFHSPSVASDPAAAVFANAGAFAGALGGQKLLGQLERPDCAAALAAARGGAVEPAAQPTPPSQPTPKQKLPNAGELLRQLFH